MQRVSACVQPKIHHLGSPAIQLSQQFDQAIADADGVSEHSDNVYDALAAVLCADSRHQPQLLLVCADLIDDSEMEFFDLLEQKCPDLEVCVYSHVSGGQRLEHIAAKASARTVSPDQVAHTLAACIDRSGSPPTAREPEQAAFPAPMVPKPAAISITPEPPAAEPSAPSAEHVESTADESATVEAVSPQAQGVGLAPAVQIAPTPQGELAAQSRTAPQDESATPESSSPEEAVGESEDAAPASPPPTPARVAPRQSPQPDTSETTFGALVTPEELAALLDRNDQAEEKGGASR